MNGREENAMEIITKEYKALKPNGNKFTDIKCELYYDLGGMNLFTYKEEPRGYYVSVTPVQREKRDGYTTETYTSFTGYKDCIHIVKRKSKKAEEIAKKAAEYRIATLVQVVLNRYGLELA